MDPIERAIEMMTAEREERTAMQDIAAAIGLSPVAFSRIQPCRAPAIPQTTVSVPGGALSAISSAKTEG